MQAKTRIRFSDVSGKVAKQNSNAGLASSHFAKTKIPRKLVYVDETAELAALYRNDSNHNDDDDDDTTSDVLPGNSVEDERQEAPQAEHSNAAPKSPSIFVPTPSTVARIDLLLGDIIAPETFTQPPEPCTSARMQEPAPPSSFIMRGLVRPSPSSSLSNNNRLEFCLLGYFIEHLSIWLDLCDPERHFELVVPHRARSCPPLMNAILAASARHLTRIPKHRTPSGKIEYNGRVLDGLTDETALQYHNKCIQALLQLSSDPTQPHNEDLLAAAIILRFYEEVDYPLQDEQRDDEFFLQVVNMFIEAQIPKVPLIAQRNPSVASGTTGRDELDVGSSPIEVYSSPSSTTLGRIMTLESRWYMSSLRQASFWVAFRMEVYSAFIKQRPFKMSLSRCDVFRSFTPGEDALWTARLIIFCADVLEFCYGHAAHAPAEGASTKERWSHLKSQSDRWIDCLPSSFEPIYFREPNAHKGEVFPEICYLTNIHVAGVQHIELARILLAVYNPNIPRLGFGHRESMRALSEELRASVLRLCGIAIHNRQNPPSLTTALLGIVVCGEHFDNRNEQNALLELLDELEWHHGWPVGHYRHRLKQSWGWLG
ncbi:uncharacterized protein BDV14DRAFT_199260 [Aspergillus stella-maris]|uniref:uncharacterized protein n=1 Tax=Aspergillus stella-maris TaxID=1810926 RepID=UPI003CCCF464